MLINREVLSLPPYISTSWGHIKALYMLEETLVVCLTDGILIKIPNLPTSILEKIFEMHSVYLTEQTQQITNRQRKGELEGLSRLEIPFRIGLGSIENMMMTALQHNQAQADMPDMPPEILSKITSIARAITPDDVAQFPKPEPHCNCMFCQLARAMHGMTVDKQPEKIPEKPVEKEEPPASPWVVHQHQENCYHVHHKESPNEIYNVFLGEGQVGCNCGKHGCDHILAVLRS